MKFGRAMRWVLINTLLVYIGYLGVYKGIGGFASVFLLFSWFTVVSAFLMAVSTATKDFKRSSERSVWGWVDSTFDVVLAGFMAYNGMIVLSAFWLVHAICLSVYYSSDSKIKEELEDE